MNNEMIYFILGILISSVTLYTIFLFKKEKLISNKVQIELGVIEESDLKGKIHKLIELNESEFCEIVGEGVQIFFNPSLDGPDCNDRDIVPGNIEDFFNELADEQIDKQEYW